jgi:hypothetical protein
VLNIISEIMLQGRPFEHGEIVDIGGRISMSTSLS